MKLFVGYYSPEQSEAEDLETHLRSVLSEEGIEIFLASSWESIEPGDLWEGKLIEQLKTADALLVLMSPDALTRPWINFEIGVAWALGTRILFLCHRGLRPDGLPRPYSSVQALDLNGLGHEDKLQRVSDAVALALSVRLPRAVEATPELTQVAQRAEAPSFNSVLRTWSLRPAAHVGEVTHGRFLVGVVLPARLDRAKPSGFQPGEALYVRLFLGPTAEGRFINAMVGGDMASFFETVMRDTTLIDADIRLAAALEEGGVTIPIFVIDAYEAVSVSAPNLDG